MAAINNTTKFDELLLKYYNEPKVYGYDYNHVNPHKKSLLYSTLLGFENRSDFVNKMFLQKTHRLPKSHVIIAWGGCLECTLAIPDIEVIIRNPHDISNQWLDKYPDDASNSYTTMLPASVGIELPPRVKVENESESGSTGKKRKLSPELEEQEKSLQLARGEKVLKKAMYEKPPLEYVRLSQLEKAPTKWPV